MEVLEDEWIREANVLRLTSAPLLTKSRFFILSDEI